MLLVESAALAARRTASAVLFDTRRRTFTDGVSCVRKSQLQCGTRHRYLSTTPKQASKGESSTSPFRVYRYVLDVHGQLFLHDTVPKNLTSCFKNVDLLDFFFKRIRPNPASLTAATSYAGSGRISRHDILTPPKDSPLPEDWSDVAPYNGVIGPQETRSRQELYSSACELGNSEGYEWMSPCGPELNLVRCQDTPLVYRELSEEGMLKWGGSLTEPFRADELMVDGSNGYVYHPSPRPSSRRGKQGGEKEKSRCGKLSLLGSNLVLSKLADGLEIDADAFERGQGGSIEWQGKRYKLGLLKP